MIANGQEINGGGITSSREMSREMVQATNGYASFSTLAVKCTDRRMMQDLFG